MSLILSFLTSLWFYLTTSQLTEVITLPDYGKLQGTVDGKTQQFRKIPYAEPPLNQLRWAPPVQAAPWEGIYQAEFDPPGCPQHCDLPPHGCPTVTDENCLYLNVFTPVGVSQSSKLAVMVFFHGGNFYQGYGGGVLYNGALGWLWSLVGPDGNYGMLDQRLSLTWVRNNIIYFGGDPNKVTIFGQSAGAMSVALHMVLDYTLPNDEKLFDAAIMESNPFALPFRDITTWGILPEKFYNEIGCNQTRFGEDNEAFWDCLRSAAVDDIVRAQWILGNDPLTDVPDHFWDVFLPWTPTMGTDLFPRQAFWDFQAGRYSDVPFIIGVVANESVPFVWGAFPEKTSILEFDLIGPILIGGDTWKDAKEMYPFPDNFTVFSDARPWVSPIVTDGLFRCPCRNISNIHLNLMSNNSKINPSYFYHFIHISSFNNALWGINNTECWDTVCHAAELPYVFHPNPSVDNTSYSNPENYLSFNMMQYWIHFAQTFTPGKGANNVPSNYSGTEWLSYDSNNEFAIVFQTGQLQGYEMYDNDQLCQFWDTTDYHWIK